MTWKPIDSFVWILTSFLSVLFLLNSDVFAYIICLIFASKQYLFHLKLRITLKNLKELKVNQPKDVKLD